MYYTFRQNNSGGGFDIDEKRGISITVIVEADSTDDADERAERLGIYFDGCETGQDCDCCGDRWSRAWSHDEAEVPSVYGTPLIDVGTERDPANDSPYGRMSPMRWAGDKPDVFVHLKDGRFFGFVLTEGGQYVYAGDPSDLPEALPAAPAKAIES